MSPEGVGRGWRMLPPPGPVRKMARMAGLSPPGTVARRPRPDHPDEMGPTLESDLAALLSVLIVEPEPALGGIWARHLERGGARVRLVHDQDAAIRALRFEAFDVVVLDLVLPGGSALAVADYASFVQPEAKVAVVTSTTFFSDGSIFRHVPNACGFLPTATPPGDLAAMVEHWGARAA